MPHSPVRPRSPAGLTAAVALVAAGAAFSAAPAQAQGATCTAEVMDLARQYALSTELPVAGHEKGEPMTPPMPPATLESRGYRGSDRAGSPLARSGGVIQPPDAGTMPTLAPPPAAGSNMPTAPGAPPMEAAPGTTPPAEASVENREKAEALLTAARIADEEGRKRDCEARLEEARNLLPPTRG